MANPSNVSSRSDRSRQTSGLTMYQGKSDAPEILAGTSSSDSPRTSAKTSANESFVSAKRSAKNVRLIPVKYKDLMRVLETNPEYKGKTPVLMKLHGDSIDRIVKQGKAAGVVISPNASIRPSPVQLTKSTMEREFGSLNLDRRSNEPGPSRPPLGEAIAPQVYAMHDVQAYPAYDMVGTHGFRSDSSPTRIRSRSPNRIKPRRRSPRRMRSRSRSRPKRVRRHRPRSAIAPSRSVVVMRPRSRSPRRRHRSRPRKVHRSRPRKVVRLRRPRRAVVEVPSRRLRARRPLLQYDCCGASPCQPQCPTYCPNVQDACCTAYPMCENDCRLAEREYGRGRHRSRRDLDCSCQLCQEKLQFIQPGVCPKKKFAWTNEYAVIPKPQVNLIDPCEKLDPSIYPRANNPCIRDANGNPLTDCIGRPLRDPIGKRFLKFNANGSVMNTNFRGNFYTGQPPLCVKCPMPGTSCGPDTTHNYWMSCGYPVLPDMSPFFERVVASEHRDRAR